MRYTLAPSILQLDWDKLDEALDGLLEADVRWIHVDIMDGKFVPNMTKGVRAVDKVRKRVPSDVFVDAHLMIDNPEFWAVDFCNAGADLVTVHVEPTNHLHSAIQSIKQAGAKVGVSLNPGTPASFISEIIGDVDLVLAMSVNPGFGGQKFIASVLPKVTAIRKMIDELQRDIELQVDGGIKLQNIGEIAKAGANNFVSGSGIFEESKKRGGNLKSVVKDFIDAIEKGAR